MGLNDYYFSLILCAQLHLCTTAIIPLVTTTTTPAAAAAIVFAVIICEVVLGKSVCDDDNQQAQRSKVRRQRVLLTVVTVGSESAESHNRDANVARHLLFLLASCNTFCAHLAAERLSLVEAAHVRTECHCRTRVWREWRCGAACTGSDGLVHSSKQCKQPCCFTGAHLLV